MRLGPGLSFSWKRAIGLSGMKARISREIGVPLTESGRERKLGRMIIHAVSWGAILVLAIISKELQEVLDGERV
jgi:hypothetical protein